jgi:S-DNA-T family DNA segregation ATPase FtsK/SpoIIIE
MIAEWFAKQRLKASVSQVFKSGDLGITFSYGQNNGKIYPRIRKVKFDYEKKTAICYFSIPAGMDPKEVKKKEYCFQQVFGKNIELKGEVKEFKLNRVHYNATYSTSYDYEKYAPSFEGMALPIVAGMI